MSFKALLQSRISSPASEAGPSRSSSLGGLELCPSGPALALASRSAQPARSEGSTTIATSGPSSSVSSASVALQSSLESRLRELLDTGGSTLYRLTWQEKATPSGQRILQRRASALPKSDRGSIGWPAPTVNDSKGSDYTYGRGDHENVCLKLPGAAKMSGWDTPNVPNGGRSIAHAEVVGGTAYHKGRKVQIGLEARAKMSGWIAAAREAGGTPEQFLARKEKAKMNGSELGVSLTALSLQAQLVQDSGEKLTGSTAAMKRSGQLNAEQSRWLMSFPAIWGEIGRGVSKGTATRSSRSSQPCSSKP